MGKILTVTANPAMDRVYFVDEFKMGEVHRPIKVAVSAGGKGINVSRVSKMLGAEVMATGFVGGNVGEFITSEMQKIGVEDRFVRIAGETRICVNFSDKNGVSGEMLERGPVISPKEEKDFIKLFSEVVKECSIVTVSGSLPDGLTSDFYRSIGEVARVNNKKVIFDTSGKLLEDIIKTNPYMVKPNRDEFANLSGSDKFEPVKALQWMKDLGVEIPFISLGGEGAVAMIDDKCYQFTIPDVKVVNSVGSGDSSVAGVATGICRGMSICDSIRLGMASGVSNTQFEETGNISKEHVKEFYEKITIKCIS